MGATIWKKPFIVSEITFNPMKVDSVTTPVNEWGEPIQPIAEPVRMKVKVKGLKNSQRPISVGIPIEVEKVIYEGFILESTSLVPDGSIGEGEINGEKGFVKVLSVPQSSIEFISRRLGKKIRFEFTSHSLKR